MSLTNTTALIHITIPYHDTTLCAHRMFRRNPDNPKESLVFLLLLLLLFRLLSASVSSSKCRNTKTKPE